MEAHDEEAHDEEAHDVEAHDEEERDVEGHDLEGVPSPELVLDTLTAYQRTAALKGAIELGLFGAIAGGASDPVAIARQIDADERGVRSLCDYLTVGGFLTKMAGGYALTAVSARFLVPGEPTYLGGVSRFLNSEGLVRGFEDIAGVVRRGGTLLGGQGTMEEENPVWVDFARDMVPLASVPATRLAEHLCAGDERIEGVLDVAAGHGLYGIELMKRRPDLRVTAADWGMVLEVAKEHAEEAGVGDRLTLLPGNSMTRDLGDACYDLVLLPNLLHHFDPPTCVRFLRVVARALRRGGRVATVELLVDDDRLAPPSNARFSLVMLATTASGDAYTHREIEQMHRDAGFDGIETVSLEPSMHHATIGRRP